MTSSKIKFARLVLLAMLVNVLAQAMHETGHLLVYQAYQRHPVWGFIGLVQIWDTPPLNPNEWVKITEPDGSTGWLRLATLPAGKTEKTLAAAAGPVASLLSVVCGLWLAYQNKRVSLKPIGLMFALLVALVMTLYYVRSPLRNLGDEYDIATQLGVAKSLVEVLFGVAFTTGFMLGLRLLDSWRTRLKWLAAILLGSVPTGFLLMVADGWVRELVNRDHPFFQPIVGYSLPVLLVYLLAWVGVFLWQYKTAGMLERS